MNSGHTVIVARGPSSDIRALREAVAATGRERFDFTLSSLFGGKNHLDEKLLWADLHSTMHELSLSVGLIREADCLGLGQVLSRRFKTLTFHGSFAAESETSDISTMGYRDDQLLYDVEFRGPVLYVPHPTIERTAMAIRLFQRSPAASRAAEIFFRAGLASLAARKPLVDTWRQLPEHDGFTLFYRPPLTQRDGDALLIQKDKITWFREVDTLGGFGREQTLGITFVRNRFQAIWRHIKPAFYSTTRMSPNDPGTRPHCHR